MKIPVLFPKIFDYPFTYKSEIPESLNSGDFVKAPFGFNEITGVVWPYEQKTEKKFKIKKISKKINVKNLKPSKRNELEIVDLLNIYLKKKLLRAEFMGRGSAWLDTGNATSLFNASQYIAAIEERQGLKIACIEEIAYQNKWISKKQILKRINFYGKCDYSDYLKKIF